MLPQDALSLSSMANLRRAEARRHSEIVLKDKSVEACAANAADTCRARRFVEEGAHVFITGRRQETLDEAIRLIGRNVTGGHLTSRQMAGSR